MQTAMWILLTCVIATACGVQSEGTWVATVTSVDHSGAPPADLADSYEVGADVERLAWGGAGECAVSAEIEGLGDGSATGGAGCNDQGFDVLFTGSSLSADIADLDAVRLSVDDHTMTLRVSGKGPDWARSFEGEATHTPTD